MQRNLISPASVSSDNSAFPFAHSDGEGGTFSEVGDASAGGVEREIFEAFQINRRGNVCISEPSVSLLDKEITYLI